MSSAECFSDVYVAKMFNAQQLELVFHPESKINQKLK